MIMNSMLKGLSNLEVRDETVCAGCRNGKVQQVLFYESKFRARQPLQLIHSDVFGPVKQPSIGGAQYMVTFLDDYSRYTWVYFMKEKSENLGVFKLFEEEAE